MKEFTTELIIEAIKAEILKRAQSFRLDCSYELPNNVQYDNEIITKILEHFREAGYAISHIADSGVYDAEDARFFGYRSWSLNRFEISWGG